ncbi:SDR family NAD(P)-dependent oxidoreductase [candidate division KSB1 bacterium]|nr:SDR family NAD(P)-dependent oxidoreductase [candidate division KSB1 bacterium]
MFINHRKLASYWTNKSVLITGASSGLGAAVVEALAPYQCHIGMLSRRVEPMQALAERLESSGSKFWIKSCDVRDRQQVYEAVDEFYKLVGRLDVVWANSGVSVNASYKRWDWERIEAVFATNLMGAIYTLRAGLEKMVPNGQGTLVAIGSAAAMRGLPTRSPYSISKIGLEYLMESYAAEFPDIQCTMIHPGWVETPISAANPNRMWLMQSPKAAQLMIGAVALKKRNYIYPWQMRFIFQLVRSMPLSLYVTLSNKFLHKIRRSKDDATD